MKFFDIPDANFSESGWTETPRTDDGAKRWVKLGTINFGVSTFVDHPPLLESSEIMRDRKIQAYKSLKLCIEDWIRTNLDPYLAKEKASDERPAH